jgi:hypothetical protein
MQSSGRHNSGTMYDSISLDKRQPHCGPKMERSGKRASLVSRLGCAIMVRPCMSQDCPVRRQRCCDPEPADLAEAGQIILRLKGEHLVAGG